MTVGAQAKHTFMADSAMLHFYLSILQHTIQNAFIQNILFHNEASFFPLTSGAEALGAIYLTIPQVSYQGSNLGLKQPLEGNRNIPKHCHPVATGSQNQKWRRCCHFKWGKASMFITCYPQRIANSPKDKFLTWERCSSKVDPQVKVTQQSKGSASQDVMSLRRAVLGYTTNESPLQKTLVLKKVVKNMFSEAAPNFSGTKLLPFI